MGRTQNDNTSLKRAALACAFIFLLGAVCGCGGARPQEVYERSHTATTDQGAAARREALLASAPAAEAKNNGGGGQAATAKAAKDGETTTAQAPAKDEGSGGSAAGTTSAPAKGGEVTKTDKSSDGKTGSGGTASVLKAYEAVMGAAEKPDLFAAPEDVIGDYYGISASDYAEAVFMLSVDSLLADEVVIVLAAGEGEAEKVAARLEKRLKNKAEEARSYSPEQFAIIEKCTVTRDGLWVAMLVSPHADLMRAAYEKAIKAG